MSYRNKLLNYFRQHDRAWMLSLFAAICLVYLPFLGNQFIFDDLNFFTGDWPDYYAHALFRFDLRWLPFASLGWTYAIFSDELPHVYRIGNVLLHVANAILLFYLMRQLMDAVISKHDNSNVVILGAWLGALFFALNPVAVYAAGYVVERSILMATLFTLLMQLAYVRGLLSGQKRWLVLAVAAYFMAGFSKEHSVMSLAVLAAMTVLLRDKIQIGARTFWLTWGAFIAVALLLILSSKGVIGRPYEVAATAMFEQQGINASSSVLHLMSALTQAGLFFKYLLLWLLPNPAWMSIDMRESFISSLDAWQGWLGTIGFMVYGILGILMLLRTRWLGLLGLALLYPWLQYIVEFSTIRVQEPFVLYRSYLWMPGLTLIMPLLLVKFPGPRTVLALGCIMILLVPLSWNRLWVFADNYRLWNDAAKLLHSDQQSGADRILHNRGMASVAEKKWQAAADDFEGVAVLDPLIPVVRHDLGIMYFNLGRYQDALVQFDKAIALNPEYAKAYFNKGITLKTLKRDDLAMQQIVQSCKLEYAVACVIVKMESQKK
jgi:protein O-mannosyl-transferase